jgi:hypothetical protein
LSTILIRYALLAWRRQLPDPVPGHHELVEAVLYRVLGVGVVAQQAIGRSCQVGMNRTE